jgi:DnaJ family protein A protein 2
MSDYYTLLGLPRSCTASDIKTAFRKKSILHHPDKTGGDTSMFQKINEAREVLSTPDTRKLYDTYGADWKQHRNNPPMGAGGGGWGPRPTTRTRTRTRVCDSITHHVKLSLEDVYNGKGKKLKIKRNVICNTCTGHGTKNKRPSKCGMCDFGTRRVVRQIGPMMIQEVDVRCDTCNGTGLHISPSNRCSDCNATGVTEGYHIIEVSIPRGVSDKTTMVFKGAADQRGGYEPGDVVIHIHSSTTSTTKSFLHKGGDLHHMITISLLEALTGFKRVIRHLDNRLLLVNHSSIVRPGGKLVIPNEGMSVENGSVKGDLILSFQILFPEQLDASSVTTSLTELLGQTKTNPSQSDVESSTPVELLEYSKPSSPTKDKHSNSGNIPPPQECRQM